MKANKEISYESTKLSSAQKAFYKNCLVLSQDGIWYRFANEIIGTRIMSPRDMFKDWNHFSEVTPLERLETLYFACFDKKPTKKLLEDKIELSVQVWIRLCETAMDRTEGDGTPSGGTNTGARRTAAKLADRAYEVIKTIVPADMKLPPQAKTCLEFFTELQTKAGHDDAKGIFTVPEKEFNAYVLANAERLKTRQDPWRIFQYYRPQLIQYGFIRLV